MLFNSYEFVFLLLPITLVVWYALNRFRMYAAAKAALIAASLVFYARFHLSYLMILPCSVGVNFLFGRFLLSDRSARLRKAAAVCGAALNLGVLGYFKYFDFFLENVNLLLGTHFSLLGVALPLGISFFTFQQLSYIIDCYRQTVPRYSLSDYALFVCFFPQLVAGPIVLHGEMIPQFADPARRRFSPERFGRGVTGFAFGLAKKVLLADALGVLVEHGFASVSALSSLQAWITMLAYTLQIYFDFSGYCDMACGIGNLFGVELPINFDSPYKALTIEDFWKRWHKTLTRFFTQYLYIPLGGSRKGKARTYRNILIVFLVSGLWHGAGYTFILWGLLHGLAVIFCRAFRKRLEKLPKALNWLLCFLFLNVTWVVFRADSLRDAGTLLTRLFAGGAAILPDLRAALETDILYDVLRNLPIPSVTPVYMLLLVAVGLLLCLLCKNTQQRLSVWNPNARTFAATAILLALGVLSMSGVSTFLYFDF